MAEISYSAFLQAIGWAALNSFWQAGLLWCFFWIANQLLWLSPQKKYVLSVACITTSFLLFFCNITYYIINGDDLNSGIVSKISISISSAWLSTLLSSASITYLILLVIPLYRMYENWLFLNKLKKYKIQKVDLEYRLFVQKMSKLLGIKKEVYLYFSEIIHSPVTIGFLKPIILLPVASLNHLTLPQAEAVLLHELAHIRRYDYLLNIFINIAHTLLYFNPFLKLFVRTAESSREESCDQIVLQFGYDKVSYASALLQLEKAAIYGRLFTIAATGKSHLLQRIEKIAGLTPKNSPIKVSHIAGFFAAIFFAFFLKALLTVSQGEEKGKPFVFSNFANPYYFLASEEKSGEKKRAARDPGSTIQPSIIIPKNEQVITVVEHKENIPTAPTPPPFTNYIIPVSLNESDARLTGSEKKQVQSTIRLVKKVLITYEWKNLKKNIPDGLTETEKNTAYKEYLAEISKINWKNLEQNLKADFNKINWKQLEANLQNKLTMVHLDSIDCETIQSEQANNACTEISISDNVPIEVHINSEKPFGKNDTIIVTKKKIIKL